MPKNRDNWVNLNQRISVDARFALDWLARQNGQSLRTAVEEAVKAAASQVKVGGKHWDEVYDEDAGVALCKLFLVKGATLHEDNEKPLKEFVMFHAPFFYRKADGKRVIARDRIVVLWPSIDLYVDNWTKRKSLDPWSTGERMLQDLKKASPKLDLPEWPQEINE